MMAAAIDAWRNRPARERWLIGVPAAALLAAVLYVAGWELLHGSIVRLRAALPELEARQEVIRAQTAELRGQPAAAAVPALDAATIHGVLEGRQLKGALPALEPAGDNRLRLAFARVPFHAAWPLLQELQMNKGIRIVSLRMDRLDGGNVRLESVLGAGDR